MADTKISAMTEATDLLASVIPIVQGGANKKAPIALFDAVFQPLNANLSVLAAQAVTWNNAGTVFTALKLDVTDTASQASSKLLDLLLGGASMFSVSKAGSFTSLSNANIGGAAIVSSYVQALVTSSFRFGSTRSRMLAPADGQITLVNAAETGFTRLNIGGNTSGFLALKLSGTELQTRLGDDSQYAGFAASYFSLDADVLLRRDAADILALRRTTNAQNFRVYNTYTDGSNNEYALLGWASNVFRVGTTWNGTGSPRAMEFWTNGVPKWRIDTSGNLLAATDNSWDIGASGATRPRHLFLSGALTLGGVGTVLLATTAAIANGAAAATGTLTNAPAVGNPTKWLPIDDNGTTRYIPAW